MKRSLILFCLLLLAAPVFTQQNSSLRIVGGIPPAGDGMSYHIQVGAYKDPRNADKALARLLDASLNPAYERHLDLFRVMIRGLSYRDLPIALEEIRALGFSELMIRAEAAAPAADLPVSDARLPAGGLREIANLTVKAGETRSLADLVSTGAPASWASSTPSAVQIDQYGNVTGLRIGNGFISVNDSAIGFSYQNIDLAPGELREFVVRFTLARHEGQ